MEEDNPNSDGENDRDLDEIRVIPKHTNRGQHTGNDGDGRGKTSRVKCCTDVWAMDVGSMESKKGKDRGNKRFMDSKKF
ncbi:hypothetical protein Gorai_012757 [Gossypium raimondii]|uniref:Uncharacterized protein n=1 Tax=Gossypium raimondii TaxID=29730 RepID=A0A7J8Q393_GOSRA|nr:hypothetical protein [Gossypium raimondii]